MHHFTTTHICDVYKGVATWRGANKDTVCHVPSGPFVLQRPDGRKVIWDSLTYKGKGCSAKKVHILAIKLCIIVNSAQNKPKPELEPSN